MITNISYHYSYQCKRYCHIYSQTLVQRTVQNISADVFSHHITSHNTIIIDITKIFILKNFKRRGREGGGSSKVDI